MDNSHLKQTLLLIKNWVAANQDRVLAARDRVSVAQDRVSVVLDRVAFTLDRVSVVLDRVSVVLDRVSVALDRVSVALDRVSVALDRVWVGMDRVAIPSCLKIVTLASFIIRSEREYLSYYSVLITKGRPSGTYSLFKNYFITKRPSLWDFHQTFNNTIMKEVFYTGKLYNANIPWRNGNFIKVDAEFETNSLYSRRRYVFKITH